MLKNYLRILKSASKKFSKDNNILDVILYGSAVRGKDEPRDVDLLIVFEKESLKKRLSIASNFKKIVKNYLKNVDVKTMNLYEFFDKSFLARQGILIEGWSLLYGEKISNRLGFKGYALFTYNLKNLDHNQKTKFTYALIGRNSKGILEDLSATSLGKGVVIVPIERSFIFEKFLQKWELNYKIKKIMMSLT